jgi:hypothetical protein
MERLSPEGFQRGEPVGWGGRQLPAGSPKATNALFLRRSSLLAPPVNTATWAIGAAAPTAVGSMRQTHPSIST